MANADPEIDAELHSLQQIFRESANRYADTRDAAMSAVVKWTWSTGEVFGLEPAFHEMRGSEPAKVLDKEPKARAGKFRTGLDANGVACVVERWAAQAPEIERFYQTEPGRRTMWIFSRQRLQSVVREIFDRDQLRAVIGAGKPPNWSMTRYFYDNGRLNEIRRHASGWPQEAVYTVEHSGGAISRISTPTDVVFVRQSRSLAELLTDLSKSLIASIPTDVARARIGERAYCVAIGFSIATSIEIAPPQLGVGYDVNRAGPLHARDLEAIWNPIRFPDASVPSKFPLDGLQDPNIVDIVAAIRSTVVNREAEIAVARAYIGVARELNHRDWSTILPTTDDFVVYAVDYEKPLWEPYMVECVPPGRLRQLRERGLIGQATH